MRILVTGATSSIGAHLVNLLLMKGDIVHVLVRKKENFQFFKQDNIRVFEGDILDRNSIDFAMRDCQQVYHLAAIAKVWLKDPSDFFQVNVQGTINVLELAWKNKVSKIVVTSSAGVYGPSINDVVNEEKVREIDFFNEYESSKLLAELKIKEFVSEKKMDIVIVSPTRVYGPILFGEVASTNLLIEKYLNKNWRILPGSGKEIGNYAYIEDVAYGHILAMENGKSGQSYILGGENCTYFEFFQKMAELSNVNRRMLKIPIWIQFLFANFQLVRANILGIEPTITPKWLGKAFYNWEVSSQKAVNEIGYRITKIEEGLSKTISSLKR